MSVDLEALKRVCEGDPNDRITVNRRWLREVYKELVKAGLSERVGTLGDKLADVFAGPLGRRK